MRPLDNFALVKGTEIRNILFYGFLPHLDSILSVEQYGHLALYVCGVRLFHSGHLFGSETSKIADRLISQFHKDHELFFNRKQSFKLHLHNHYALIYQRFGSFSNLGCFAQESFIGFVSANYHEIRYYGDAITYYFNIDFSIRSKKSENSVSNGPTDRSPFLANTYPSIDRFHSKTCGCDELNCCCLTYRRFVIHNQMFHSLAYNRRQNSVSYFVSYRLTEDGSDDRFGVIESFFTCNDVGYAVIRAHDVKCLFSDYFHDSSYYYLLKQPIDKLYFILEKQYSRIDLVRTDYIQSHCIVVYKNDHLFVSKILCYDEHD